MHGATALSVIKEKLDDEQLSQDEDEDSKTLNLEYLIISDKSENKKVQDPMTSQENIDRVTSEILKKFEKSPDSSNKKSIFSHNFLESNNTEEEKQHVL
jgi:hypothetical protein